MKTINLKFILKITTLLFIISLVSCSDDTVDLPVYDNITEGNPLKLEVSEDSIVLNQAYSNEQALLFTWEDGRERSPDSKLTYLFKLDITSSNFETSILTEEMPEGVYFKSFTTKELNNLIENHWKQPLGEKIELSARIIAKVSSEDKYRKPDYSTVTFTVRSYTHEANPLFLVGDATVAGWDTEKALMMNEVEARRVYSWRGVMSVGNYKFLQQLGEMLPSFNKGINNNTFVERTSEQQPDNLFSIKEEGIYSILLNRRTMQIECLKVPFEKVYYGGSATSAGWNNFEEMKFNPSQPNVFETTINLFGGEIKFYTGKSVDFPTFRPLKPDASIIDDLNVQVAVLPDWKWKVKPEEAGRYKITLDTESLRIEFKKLD